YNQAIALKPNFALAYFNRGNNWRKQGHDTPAFSDLNDSIRLDPNYAAAYSNRARLLRDHGKIDRALDDFDQSLRLDTDNYRGDHYPGTIPLEQHGHAKTIAV